MKRSLCFLISILTLLTLVLSGCSDNAAPDGYQNAAGESEPFYLYVPTTWVLNNSGGTASAYYSSDDYSNVTMTCMVIDPDEMDELEEYKAITLAELESVLPDFKVVETPVDSDIPEEEKAPLTLGGRDAISFEYECTLGGKTYRYMQVVTLKDDFFYLLTDTSLAENYDKHLEAIGGIIENVTFKKY